MSRINRVISSSGFLILNGNNDGVDHINIYSAAKTALGRKLSNFSNNPFTHPEFGRFESIEGFWYWYSTGQKFDILKTKWGIDAKAYGKKKARIKVEDFEERILECIHYMLQENQELYDLLLASSLPLTHYYSYSNVLKDNPSAEFMLKEFDLLRSGKPLKI